MASNFFRLLVVKLCMSVCLYIFIYNIYLYLFFYPSSRIKSESSDNSCVFEKNIFLISRLKFHTKNTRIKSLSHKTKWNIFMKKVLKKNKGEYF